MKSLPYIYLFIFLALSLVSCRKDDSAVGNIQGEILFRLNTPEVVSVKSEVTTDNLLDDNVSVKVYESLNSSGPWYNGGDVQPEKEGDIYTGVWKTNPVVSWENYNFSNMSFYALVYSPDNALDNGLTIKSKGLQIDISQPLTYNPVGNIDYLMASPVRVPVDIAKGRVIPFNLEHAMSKVEVYLYCADAMVSNDDVTVTITLNDLRIERMHHSATLTYAPQSLNEKWTRQNYGSANAAYSLKDPGAITFSVLPKSANLSDNLAMEFIAIPVDNPDMESRLYVDYDVTITHTDDNSESIIHIENYFNLKDYTPLGWMSNHKVKYELEIDTGISLTGRIVDWIAVDYIEGIVLPEISDDEDL